MTRQTLIEHRFVDSAPDDLEDNVLYVSILYATALHLCPCGCGSEIITPISRKGWSLTFDGDSVTLHPSVGNWNYPCRSHYWIRRDRIEWAEDHFHDRPGWQQRPAGVQNHEANEVAGVRRLAARVRRWLRQLTRR